jgi:toxin-antitoxin system PIN domain toxin
LTILDANVLLYAYDMDAPQHAAAAKWLAALAAGNEVIGIPWVTIWAFLRISTNSRIYARPKLAKEAFSIIHDWLAQPGVVTPEPGPRHVRILEDLMNSYAVSGGLVMDAVLAAIAMENGATLASTDQDFRRFPHLRWVDPVRGT